MADKLKSLKKENKELKKLLAKAKALLLTYHDILKQPENIAAAARKPAKKKSPKRKKPRRSVGKATDLLA